MHPKRQLRKIFGQIMEFAPELILGDNQSHPISHGDCRGQILETGTFRMTVSERSQLWQSIDEGAFWSLTDDYRMSIGGAYAFMVVEANGEMHTVDNIGMDVPEIEKIVETLNSMIPAEIELEYTKKGPW